MFQHKFDYKFSQAETKKSWNNNESCEYIIQVSSN